MVDCRHLSQDISLNIFFIAFCKILIRKHLGTRGIAVLGKILRRKDLRVKSSGIRSSLSILGRRLDGWRKTGRESFRASLQLARSRILSKGCSSQFWEKLSVEGCGKG
jgi:hypothetical protein